MKHINKTSTHTVELTTKEVELLSDLTQNPNPADRPEIYKRHLGLLVGFNRMLGFDMKDDGTLIMGM